MRILEPETNSNVSALTSELCSLGEPAALRAKRTNARQRDEYEFYSAINQLPCTNPMNKAAANWFIL